MLLECFISVKYIKKEEVSRFFCFGIFVCCFLMDVFPESLCTVRSVLVRQPRCQELLRLLHIFAM